MPIPTDSYMVPEARLEQVLHHLEQCRELAPLIDDPTLSAHLQAAFDICLERFCEFKRVDLECRIIEARRH